MAFILRFLRSVKYDNEAAYTAMHKYFAWREAKLPVQITDKLIEIIVFFIE